MFETGNGALASLGESTKQAIYFHLEKKFKIGQGWRKAVTGMMLTLLLLSVLAMAFDAAPAIASLTVHNINRQLDAHIVTKPPSDTVYQVTIVTGDVVIVTDLSGGQKGISIIPADPTKLGQSFQAFETPEGTYVFPSNINLDKLDIELFNVDYLISEGYHKSADLPVVVSTAGLSEQIIQSIESGLRDFEGMVTDSFSTISALAVQLPLDTIKDSIQTLLERADVEKIWLDRTVHICLGESVPLIGAPELWDAEYNGTGVEIAILDTGIDDTHPDLDDLDDDPGTADPKVIRAIDFTDDFTTEDLFGHGTHCAGIAAGTGAKSGGINKGVAPGAFLWNVKVLDQYGSGYESWIISGIEYAAYGPDGIDNTGDEADIISMSLGAYVWTDGTDPMSMAVDAAIDAEITVVVAAGNWGDYFGIGIPGTARKAITVGASTKEDQIASLSSRGPTIDWRIKPDVLAPGVSITSCVPYNLYGMYYQSWSGTSMATPHVAGAVALILQKGVPLDWKAPQYAKNTLISTAVDLGYDVYTQGGGRIYVPSAAYAQVLVDPATVSFGFYSEDTLDNATLTFYNLNETSNRVLALSATVYDMYTGAPIDCVSLNTTTLNIDPGSNASVLLTINTAVPESVYSGILVADVDTGDTVHAIFGFAKLNEVTVTKVDMMGAPAADDFVYVIGDPGFPELTYKWTDQYGNATFYVIDGTYDVISMGMDYATDSTVYTIVEDRSISGNAIVNLDERDTVPIDFDMNKPAQILAEKNARLVYEGEHFEICFFGILWWYPSSALAYVSPTSFSIGFAYSYYPQAYYKASDPGTIDTPEWHKLLFTPLNIFGSVTFIADYDDLVQRTTDYKVAIVPDVAERVQFVQDPIVWCDTTFVWRMTVPQSRLEWLSPEPAYYFGWYSKWDPMWDWDFEAQARTYPHGAETYLAFGEHPFTSGAEIDVHTGYFDVWGSISEDTFGNNFANFTRNISGNLTVLQDGVEVYQTEIWDHFWESLSFPGTPVFNVIIEGDCDLNLSKNTSTELTFTANPTHDCQPPQVTMRPRDSNLSSFVQPGEVLVDLNVSDESPISPIALEYSLDDGTVWHLVSLTEQDPNTWIANLGMLSDSYVSLRVNATDSWGNRISQTTIRGFYVALLTVCAHLDPSVGSPGTEVTINGTATPNGTVQIYWDDMFMGSTTANTAGEFTYLLTVPITATVGVNEVMVLDVATGRTASAPFRVILISSNPTEGPVGTKVTVSGGGFLSESQVTVTFNDMLIGYAMIDEFGDFTFTFNIPLSSVETQVVKALDPEGNYAHAVFTVVDTTPLDVQIDVADTYFRGEIAEFYAQTTFKGKAVDGNITSAVLYKPDGTTESLTAQSVTTGLYKMSYTIPGDAEAGMYTLVVTTSYVTGTIQAEGTAFKCFLISPTLTGWNALLISVNGTVGTIKTDVGLIHLKLDTLNITLISINETLATLNSTVGLIQTDIENIQLNVTAINGNIATIETTLGTMNGTITSIEGKVATILVPDVGEIKTDISSLKRTQETWAIPQYTILMLALIAAIGAVLAVLLLRGRKTTETK
jgi:subtilisin family serine protease